MISLASVCYGDSLVAKHFLPQHFFFQPIWRWGDPYIVGPLPVTHRNNKYTLTFPDDLSKYVVAVPIHQQDAETMRDCNLQNHQPTNQQTNQPTNERTNQPTNQPTNQRTNK
jgi:hypothetical protein